MKDIAAREAELRAAVAKATDGPWAYRPQQYDDWGFIRGPEGSDSEGDALQPVVAISRGEWGNHDEHRRNKTDPYRSNGEAIVALRNDALAIIDNHAARADRAEAENARLREELAGTRISLLAFGGPFAAQYARDHGLPAKCLHPVHYDILAKAGGRMDDFTRAALSPAQTGDDGRDG